MAKGRRCSQCDHYMYAIKEEVQEKGCYVTYQCRWWKCKMLEKHFEPHNEGFEDIYKNPPNPNE